MSYPKGNINWADIEAIDTWLNEEIGVAYKSQPLARDWARISKISEELGEVTGVFIGLTGQNPRKGIYGSPAGLTNELADVALTAILAIQHFTKNIYATSGILEERIDNMVTRIPKGRNQHDADST